MLLPPPPPPAGGHERSGGVNSAQLYFLQHPPATWLALTCHLPVLCVSRDDDLSNRHWNQRAGSTFGK